MHTKSGASSSSSTSSSLSSSSSSDAKTPVESLNSSTPSSSSSSAPKKSLSGAAKKKKKKEKKQKQQSARDNAVVTVTPDTLVATRSGLPNALLSDQALSRLFNRASPVGSSDTVRQASFPGGNAFFKLIETPDTSIIQNIVKGHLGAVEQYIKQHGVNKKLTEYQHTLLILSVQHEQLVIFNKLLDEKADIQTKNTLGDTALKLAVDKKQKEMLDKLLKLHLAQNLWPAIRDAFVRAVIKTNKFILDIFIPYVRLEDVCYAFNGTAEKILSEHLDLSLISKKNIAANRTHLRTYITKILANQGDSKPTNAQLLACLKQTIDVTSGNHELLKQLSVYIKQNNIVFNPYEINDLLQIALRGKLDNLQILIEGLGIDCNKTPVFLNALGIEETGEERAVTVAMTLLHLAIFMQKEQFCDFFIKYGINVNIPSYPMLVSANNEEKAKAVVKEQIKKITTDKTEQKQGAVFYIKETGTTPLMSATYDGNLSLVKKLLAAGAFVDAVNLEGNTALIWAAQRGNKDLVRLLIDKGADIDLLNIKNESAISLARKNNHPAIVRILEEASRIQNAREDNSDISEEKEISNQQTTAIVLSEKPLEKTTAPSHTAPVKDELELLKNCLELKVDEKNLAQLATLRNAMLNAVGVMMRKIVKLSEEKGISLFSIKDAKHLSNVIFHGHNAQISLLASNTKKSHALNKSIKSMLCDVISHIESKSELSSSKYLALIAHQPPDDTLAIQCEQALLAAKELVQYQNLDASQHSIPEAIIAAARDYTDARIATYAKPLSAYLIDEPGYAEVLSIIRRGDQVRHPSLSNSRESGSRPIATDSKTIVEAMRTLGALNNSSASTINANDPSKTPSNIVSSVSNPSPS